MMNRGNKMGLGYEDPLTYLPRKPAQEVPKGRTIYDGQRPSDGLYVVILGRVKIVSASEDGCQTIGRIVCAEGLFGESALLGQTKRSTSAVAIDNVTLMAWSREEIEQQIEQEPRLGIALSQYLVRQCLALQDRIESMAIHKTPERVMLALVQLAADLGTPQPDGSMQIGSLTHHTIADYVGTSREIVTFQMNRLRRLGLLRYSRKHIDIYSLAIQDTLREQGVNVPQTAAAAQRAFA
ncbi:MAG: Crp/Fnr family transcriptional regulator [Acidobacteriia bacterium]|nr:Crp/Fnr family transcriptional regulator [Terriglobia bacterium]